jgi:hypothetical protein
MSGKDGRENRRQWVDRRREKDELVDSEVDSAVDSEVDSEVESMAFRSPG